MCLPGVVDVVFMSGMYGMMYGVVPRQVVRTGTGRTSQNDTLPPNPSLCLCLCLFSSSAPGTAAEIGAGAEAGVGAEACCDLRPYPCPGPQVQRPGQRAGAQRAGAQGKGTTEASEALHVDSRRVAPPGPRVPWVRW